MEHFLNLRVGEIFPYLLIPTIIIVGAFLAHKKRENTKMTIAWALAIAVVGGILGLGIKAAYPHISHLPPIRLAEMLASMGATLGAAIGLFRGVYLETIKGSR